MSQIMGLADKRVCWSCQISLIFRDPPAPLLLYAARLFLFKGKVWDESG
jgi:hypothetical protein